jgi:hypothetical protein
MPSAMGDYPQFSEWTRTPQMWGHSSSVVFCSGVIPDLIEGIREHAESGTSGYWRGMLPQTVAIGCVPWLNHPDVVSALLELGQVCVVVDKKAADRATVTQLHDAGTPLVSTYLPGFENLSVLDEQGRPFLIAPNSGRPDPVDLGPVRVAGWQRPPRGQPPAPLLHAKMLVLGVTTLSEDENTGEEVWRFEPKRTWLGSANWTVPAMEHFEFGIWGNDPDLVRRNLDALLDVLRFSEPWGSTHPGPQPELVEAEWADDQEFIDYLAEWGPEEPDER